MATASQIDEFKYWAFISYCHRDEQWGDWLHRSLETYRVPKRLVGQPNRDGVRPRRLFPVFRDREELPVSADLGSRVHQALAESRYLVVVCSPNAAKALVEKEPGNSIWLNDMFTDYVMLGDVSSAQGDLSRAKTEYQEALDVIQKTVKLEPRDTRWLRNLAATHNRVGDALKALGDLNGAEVQYEKGLELTDRLAKQDPSNGVWQVDLFVSYDDLGFLLLAQGNFSEAKVQGLNGRAIIEKLVKQDPGNTDWQYNLSISHEDLGDIYRARKDFGDAFAEKKLVADPQP